MSERPELELPPVERLTAELDALRLRVAELEQEHEGRDQSERVAAEQRLALERAIERARARGDRLERLLHDERIATAHEARRIAHSRAWRWGHALANAIRILTFRRPIRRLGGADALAERLERQLEHVAPTLALRGGDAVVGPGRWHEFDEAGLVRLAGRRPISVVVPIHNAADDLERCLRSLVRNTAAAEELILVDDASTDPAVARVLAPYERLPNVRVIRHRENRGFAASANAGFERAAGDVVLLNSDTEVPPRWLENLIVAAHSAPRIATATPLSNNAGAFSAPEHGIDNPYPRNMSKDEVGRLVTRASDRIYPRTPTGNGFCMYVKRDALEDVGGFDAEAFPEGYGEENDFCMRAGEAGWEHVIDDATLVFHRRQASFGDRKEQLTEASRVAMDSRHPTYRDRVREFLASRELGTARRNVLRAYLRSGSHGERTRVLFALHAGGGGTPQTAMDLIGALSGRYECFVLTSDTRTLALSIYNDGRLEPLDSWVLDPPWQVTDLTREDYRRIVSSLLVTWGIELVHVRHLIKHTFDLPEIARSLGIPVVLSFHDHYLCCPTVHLLDERKRYCAATCTPGDGACALPTGAGFEQGTPPLKHRWIYEWRDAVNRMLESVDACVTTSEHARQVHTKSLAGVRGVPFELIEHGRDLEQERGHWTAPDADGPIRVLVAGNLTVSKGADFIREIQSHDRAGRIEWHFIGNIRPEYQDLGICHGRYRRDEFAGWVRTIRPSFLAALSICGETYSHVVTEAWAAGLPVLVNDIGTFGERIRGHGGGWLLDHTDAERSYRRILEIAADPDGYRRVAAEVSIEGIPTSTEMADRYDLLYRRVSRRRLAFSRDPAVVAGANGSPIRPEESERVLEVGLVLEGEEGRRPPTAHVRCLRPLDHPLTRPRALATADGVERRILEDGPSPDVVVVQRAALVADRAGRLLASARRRDLPVVLELDDDLFEPDQEGPGAGEAVRLLASEGDRVIVSTQALAEVASRYAGDVAVVPNMLDERLWIEPFEGPRHEAEAPRRERLRVLYSGGTSHRSDLELVRPAFELLRERHGVDLELEVVGAAAEDKAGWYRPLVLPPGRFSYPSFATWLRENARRWDFAIAPLRDTPFNRCKSDLKLLEYGALGLPAVFSDVGVYDSSVHGETGLLSANTPAAWAEAIGWLVSDPVMRERIGSAAHDYVVGERCLAAHPGHYLEALPTP